MLMKFKTLFVAVLLLPSFAMAQAYDPSTGQRFDQYGRPLPSIQEMCREGQMAGGPITLQCAVNGYRFNEKGEQLVPYNFIKWGYNLLTLIPQTTADRLDADPKFRISYIKSHHIQPYVKHAESDADEIGMRNGRPITRGELRALCATDPRDTMCR
jgi:hypothetical protein